MSRTEDYRSLVDEAPAMIWFMEPTTLAVFYLNRSSLEFTGIAESRDPVEAWRERIHPDDADRYLSEIAASVAEERPFSIECRTRRADGAYRWVVDSGRPHRDSEGRLRCYVGATLDITEQVEAQEALRARQQAELEQLRSLLPICSHCKRIRDDDGRWHEIEAYVSAHMSADFTHGLCPACLRRYEEE